MRLLNVNTLQLEEFTDNEIPRYAILSHRWEAEEVTFKDIDQDTANSRKCFHKLRMACKRASWDGLAYIWIDTCCIDKSSSAELSEAINSMFRWYTEADRCYAYLYDVRSPDPGEEVSFSHSVWFTRAWTLQELIASAKIFFYDRDWKEFGSRVTLIDQLTQITGIPGEIFRGAPLMNYSIAQRMSWASSRKATRKEDIAYSLLGLFDINMPMLYGEGDKAFLRLQEEIIRRSNDQSVLLWSSERTGQLLAPSPAAFSLHKDQNYHCPDQYPNAFLLGNAGLEIELRLVYYGVDVYLACLDWHQDNSQVAIFLKLLQFKENRGVFARISLSGRSFRLLPVPSAILDTGKRSMVQDVTCTIRTMASWNLEVPCNGFVVDEINGNLSIFGCGHPTVQKKGNFDVRNDCFTQLREADAQFTWTCSILISWPMQTEHRVGRSSARKSVKYLVFKLGFDFWSNPICYIRQDIIPNGEIMPEQINSLTTDLLNGLDTRMERLAGDALAPHDLGHDKELVLMSRNWAMINHDFRSLRISDKLHHAVVIKRDYEKMGKPWRFTLTSRQPENSQLKHI